MRSVGEAKPQTALVTMSLLPGAEVDEVERKKEAMELFPQSSRLWHAGCCCAEIKSVRNGNRRKGDISSGASSTCANYYSKTEITHKTPFYERSHVVNKKSRAGATPEGDVNTSSQAGLARAVKQ